MENASVSVGEAATMTLQGVVFSSKGPDRCKHSEGCVALYRHLVRFSGDAAACAASAVFCLHQRQRWKQVHVLLRVQIWRGVLSM